MVLISNMHMSLRGSTCYFKHVKKYTATCVKAIPMLAICIRSGPFAPSKGVPKGLTSLLIEMFPRTSNN